MSRIRNCITLAAGGAAGLFLTALASSATAAADPMVPALPGVVDQVIASSAGIPQQLLQTTTSALTGAPLTPAAAQAPTPIATATVNLPQTPAGLTPGLTPGAIPAAIPGAIPAASAPAMPGFQMPPSLSSLLPFPLPNLGGSGTTVAAPTVTVPGAFLPSAPAMAPGMAPGAFLPSAPAMAPGAFLPSAPAAAPVPTPPAGWMPVSGLP